MDMMANQERHSWITTKLLPISPSEGIFLTYPITYAGCQNGANSIYSVKTGAVVGKSVAKLVYRSKHTKSYYLGCSSGGRQGFKAVQDFPDEFDGLVIGSPALGFNTMAGWTGNFITITGTSTSKTFLPMDLWAVVNTEVMNQCDEIDGVKDGIIEDPNLCKFNATAMLCAPGKSTGCLTKAQVTTVNRVFSDLIGEDGSSIYPRMQPGSEILASQVYYNGVASPFTVSPFALYLTQGICN